MATQPLMPKATAVWLVDNTALSFEQIAAFCNLHPLEVRSIADGDAAQGIKGADPDPGEPDHPRGNRSRRERPQPQAQAGLAEGEPAGSARHQRRTLYAGVAPPGSPERDPLAGAQPSRTQGRADHAPRRHPPSPRCRRSATARTGIPPPRCSRSIPSRSACAARSSSTLKSARAAKEKPRARGIPALPCWPADVTTAKHDDEDSESASNKKPRC